MSTLKVDIRVGETLQFDGTGKVSVTLSAKSGQLARLRINAAPTIQVALPSEVTARSVASTGLGGGVLKKDPPPVL